MVRRLEFARFLKSRFNSVSIWVLLPAAAMSLLITAADYRLANSARTAASRIATQRPGPLGKLWFEGHWGFQYYMQALGAEPVDVERNELENGDFLAVPTTASNIFSIPKEALRLSIVVEVDPMPLVATMDTSLGSGFYASEWGPLPFAIGPVLAQRYELFSIVHSIRFAPPANH
jgi:hypothetical protein